MRVMDWHGLGLVEAFERSRRKSKFDFVLLGLTNFLFGTNLFLLLADVGEYMHAWSKDSFIFSSFFILGLLAASMRFSNSRSI